MEGPVSLCLKFSCTSSTQESEKYSCAMAKPWLKEIDVRKRQAQKIAWRQRTDESWSRYKSVKNQVNEAIKLAKYSYFNTYFEANYGNIKNSWKGITLFMAKTPQSTRINALKIGDVSYTSPQEISDVLNSHFPNVGPALASEIPPSKTDFSDYVHPYHIRLL